MSPDLVVIGAQVAGEEGINSLRERLDCACLTIQGDGAQASLPATEQVLQLRIELALRENALERERARAESGEQVSRATARAIHEINNLLSAIRCNAFLIQSETVAPRCSKRPTTSARRSALRSADQDVSSLLRDQRLRANSTPSGDLMPRARRGGLLG